MTPPDSPLGRLLLLGENYGEYGGVGATRVGARSAAAISVGSDPSSPSSRFKHDPRVANEDALCVIEAGEWVGMAVADAHFGPESSHILISRIHDIWAKIRPTDLGHLGQMVDFLRSGEPALTESETTLLVCVFDRADGVGFGLSFGDSTLAVAGPGRLPVPINPQDNRFVTTRIRSSLQNGGPFHFRADPGELVLAYTDGIDGCHYRSPATSVQAHHIADIAEETGYDPFEVVSKVTALALGGVDGNPGGQDNVAIVAASA